jgi:hypothetical protein
MLAENRLALIRKWSMEGARAAIAGERAEEQPRHTATAGLPPVLVKPAGESDWRPLLADPSHA